MPDPITFTTEAERMKAREQYVAIRRVIGGACAVNIGETFDAYFPPIAPPKMVPFEAWATVASQDGEVCVTGEREPGNWMGAYAIYKHRPEIASEVAHLRRIARVRVVEVDDE